GISAFSPVCRRAVIMNNDQKHKQYITQRNHVHFRHDPVLRTTNRHSHEPPRRETFFPRGGLSHHPKLLRTPKTYCPASIFAVIKPTLSMPAPRMISMARATSANSTSLSPLTKAIFSARSLKICSMRGPRPSQVASSLLILTLLFDKTCTTTVLFSKSWF